MKKQQLEYQLLALALIVAALLLVGGCATHSPQSTVSAAEATPEEPAWEIEPWDGYGLEIPLDGTSREAWDRSLYRVKAYSEPADYELLLSAIEYLRVYDLGARGDMDILITRLNGLTGYEVLSRVKYRKPPGFKIPAKKETNDAAQPQSG